MLSSNNRNVQARMCAQRFGIAVLPRVVGDQVAGLRRLQLPDDPPGRDIWMGYHRDRRWLGRFLYTTSGELKGTMRKAMSSSRCAGLNRRVPVNTSTSTCG